MNVSRRRFAFLAALLVAVNAAFWLAQTGFAGLAPGILQQMLGGQRLIRAEIVWQTPGGPVEDTRIDRGVVMSVAQDQIVLKEKDGTTQTIPLASDATVTGGFRTWTVANLRRGLRVVVSRPATGAADTIQIEGIGQ